MNQLGGALPSCTDPPVKVLFVYNCNPLATVPDQNRVRQRPRARGPLHRRPRAGHDRHGAVRRRGPAGDDLPRALRHRQGLRRLPSAPRAAGHRRRSARRDRTTTSFASWASGSGCRSRTESRRAGALMDVAARLPGARSGGARRPARASPGRRPADPVRRRHAEDRRRQGAPLPAEARPRARRPLQLPARSGHREHPLA